MAGGNYATLGQTSAGQYNYAQIEDDKKKKPPMPAPAAPPMAANVRPAAPVNTLEAPRARIAGFDGATPSRSDLTSNGKVATPESREAAIAYDQQDEKPAPTVDYAKEFKGGTKSNFDPKSPLDKAKMDALKAGDKNWADNKLARERMSRPTAPAASAPVPAASATAPATGSTAKPTMAADVKPNNAEMEKNKTAMDNAPTGANVTGAKAPRINPATGLPFGYRPGDKLPSGSSPEMQTRANESESRQAQTRPASEAYAKAKADEATAAAAAKSAPRPGSLEDRDARVAKVKENVQKEYEQRQAQGKANQALWEAGDKTLKDAGIKMKQAPASYDWLRKQQAEGNYKGEIPKETRSERKALEQFYNENPGIKNKSADKWRDGKPMSQYDEGTSGSKKGSNYDTMMKKRTGPMSKR